MSFYRRQVTRTDASQDAIVATLRKAGVSVWLIGRPVDALTYYNGRWLPLEIKSPGVKPRKDQAAQNELLADFQIPRVTTPEEALKAVQAVSFGDMEG